MRQRGFEAIARDAPVKAQGAPDPSSTTARLGQGLQRLYQPAQDQQPDRLGKLLNVLQQHFADSPK